MLTGQGSAARAVVLAHQRISVIQLPRSGIDPDEFVRQEGADELQRAIDNRVGGSRSLVEHHARGVHLSSVPGCPLNWLP